jgi:hypothetical protein
MENNNYKIGLKLLDENIKKLQNIKKNIKKLNTKYKNNFLHISMEKINKNKLKNTNKINESRYGNSPVYYNPEGLWISCGASWYNYSLSKQWYDESWLNFDKNYLYDVLIDKSKILFIKKIDELIDFHNTYSFKKDNSYIIDWTKVKKKYDGLIICPYLGYKIWNQNKDLFHDFHLNINSQNYIKMIIGKNIKKYPAFFLEWYRHWDTGSGVIWRKRSIKELKLIKL